MVARHSRIILAAASAAILACSPDRESLAPSGSNGGASLDLHGGSTTCQQSAVGIFISVDPKSLKAGERSTFYATISASDGGTLPASTVQWSVADTNVATVGGPDENGRFFAIGRAAGTTQVVGRCGDLSATASLSVGGGSTTTPPGTTAAPTNVVVSLGSTSLQPSQTTQATVQTLDASGRPLSSAVAVWTSTNPGVATVNAAGLVTAVASGSTSITATVGTVVGSAALAVATTTTPPPVDVTPPSGLTPAMPEAPRAGVPDARFVAPTGRIIRVPAGGGVQEALDSAQPGDAVVLTAGASHYGNFVLPANGGGAGGTCTTWTTLTSDGSLPADGDRATPSVAAGAFAKLLTPNVDAALKTAPGASCWRVVGVEIAVAPSFTGLHYGLLLLGNGDVSELAQQPHGVVLDRVYVHGQTSTNLIRCVTLNSIRTAIINSWISDCHARGFDSQAIEGWNGPGPYLIENNFLSAAGENVMFGGADPRIYGLSPSDITIRRNHVYKDPTWKGVWTVKNLFELKNARRVLVEGNVFENNWADAQAGMAIVIKSSQDACSNCTWQGTQDVTFRYNIVRNSPRGFNLQAVDGSSDFHVARVRAEHNLFQNIGTFLGTGADGWLMLLTHDLRDITIAHNTLVHSPSVSGFGVLAMMDYSFGAARNISIRDNVFTNPAGYSIMYSGAQVGTKSLEAFAGSSWAFDRNVSIGVAQDLLAWHPTTSFYPSTIGAVGFMNFAGGDYRLGSSSPYKGKATDSTDPGADLDRLSQMTANVVR